MKSVRRVTLMITGLMTGSILAAGDMAPQLVEARQDRSMRIKSANNEYRETLEDLKWKFMRKGDLDSANQAVEMLKRLSIERIGEIETRWNWESGGVLVLKPGGVATHSVWKTPGKWEETEDGSIRLEGPFGEFRIAFLGITGHVVHLKEGSRTTISPKI